MSQATKTVLDPKVVNFIRKTRGDHFSPNMSYAKIKDAVFEKYGISLSVVGVEYVGRGISYVNVEGPEGWVPYPLAHNDTTILQKVRSTERKLGVKNLTGQPLKDLIATIQGQKVYDIEKAVRSVRSEDIKAVESAKTEKAKKAETKAEPKPETKTEPEPKPAKAKKAEPKPAKAETKAEPKPAKLTAEQVQYATKELAKGVSAGLIAKDLGVSKALVLVVKMGLPKVSNSEVSKVA